MHVRCELSLGQMPEGISSVKNSQTEQNYQS